MKIVANLGVLFPENTIAGAPDYPPITQEDHENENQIQRT